MATALITGGTGGLGVSVVEVFLEAGWRVVVPYIVGGEQERLPEAAEAVEADLGDPDDVGRVVRTAADDESQPLRALVNLVGGYKDGMPVFETPFPDFEALFKLNVRPTYLVTQAALPRLVAAGGGAIVCVSAKAALDPWAGGSALRGVQGGRHGAGARGGEGARRRRRALQRHRADDDRHACQPGRESGREDDAATGDRHRRAVPLQ